MSSYSKFIGPQSCSESLSFGFVLFFSLWSSLGGKLRGKNKVGFAQEFNLLISSAEPAKWVQWQRDLKDHSRQMENQIVMNKTTFQR